MLVDHKRYKALRLKNEKNMPRNLKIYTNANEKQMSKKDVNDSDRKVRNRLT